MAWFKQTNLSGIEEGFHVLEGMNSFTARAKLSRVVEKGPIGFLLETRNDKD